MGSTNFTEHYSIPLPLGSDKTTPMDYNQSMQDIDTALFTAQGDASDAKTGLATTNQNVAQNAQDISSLAGRVTTVEGTVSSQGTAITNLGTKVDGVEQDAQDMICAYNEASATASRNYAVGDYFIYNDVLYRATQAITAGGTIVPDTNCTTTNVTSEIKNFSPDLSAYQTKQDNELDTSSKEVVGAINELKSDLYKDYVIVIGNGVKTTTTLLGELWALVDTSKITDTSYIVHERSGDRLIFEIGYAGSGALRYGHFTVNQLESLNLGVGNSYTRIEIGGDGTIINTDKSHDVIGSGHTFKLYY